jgi:antitoxin ParD1/3/4
MSTMIISMPKLLRSFVAEQVTDHGYENGGEYIRELIRRDLDRQKMQRLLIEGALLPAPNPCFPVPCSRSR